MSQWVRLWDDLPTDPKWRVIARKSGRAISEVIAVFNFMMINAADWKHRGELSAWEDEDIGAALDIDGDCVRLIREAMQGKVLDGAHLTGWEKRQTKCADESTERVRAFRKRCNDVKRNETVGNGYETLETAEEKRRELDKKKERESATHSCRKRVSTDVISDAKRFYEAYPKHVDPRAAETKFNSIVKSGVDPEHIIAAASRYAEAHRMAGTDKQMIPAPAVWLNKGGYDSEDLPKPQIRDGPKNGFHSVGMTLAEMNCLPGFYAPLDSPQWAAWADYWFATKGQSPPTDAKGGWRFPSEWPPKQDKTSS